VECSIWCGTTRSLVRARCAVIARRALRAQVFPTLVQQSVTNLVLNALDAVRDGGRVEVELREAADAMVIEVHDDGPGVTESDRERIFDPFFTTKAHGTGLGLVSVRTCAQLHGGEVTIGRSERLGGAVFRLTLRAPRPRGLSGGSP
jgi:signal transduction histidine kinase